MKSLKGVFSGLTSLAIAATATVPAFAAPREESFEIAQAQSLCRQVYEPRGLVIRAEPTTESAVVGGVDRNANVTLAENFSAIRGPEGRNWIPITYPAVGYVSNGYPSGRSNLVYCTTAFDPEPEEPVDEVTPGELCRRVIEPQGLTVRREPTPFSARMGGVDYNGRVTLVEGYQGIEGPEGRIWIGISAPMSGYVSNGYGGRSNLGRCIQRF